MVGNPGAEEPNEQVCNYIATKKDDAANALVEEKKYGSQEQQRHRIRNQVSKATVYKWRCKHTNEPRHCTWPDPKPAQVNLIKEFYTVNEPHEKDNPKGYCRAPEERIVRLCH